jgi:hypothetical protein
MVDYIKEDEEIKFVEGLVPISLESFVFLLLSNNFKVNFNVTSRIM